MQDLKLKKSLKFDHVWIFKIVSTFSDNVNIGILDTENGIDSSPTSQSPGFSLFSISLSSDDGSLNTSQHPIG